MEKITIIVGILIIAVAAVAGAYFMGIINNGQKVLQNDSDPYELYSQLIEKSTNADNLTILYMDDSESAPGLQFTKLGGMEKINQLGETSFGYMNNGKTITCFIPADDPVDCVEIDYDLLSLTGFIDLFNLRKSFNITDKTKMDLKIIGEKNVSGRTCINFNMTIPLSSLSTYQNKLDMYAQIFEYKNDSIIMLENCLDKEYGLPLLTTVSVKEYSKTEEKLLTIRAEFLLAGVKPVDVEIPVPFIIDDWNCSKNSVNATIKSTINGKISKAIMNISNYTNEAGYKQSLASIEKKEIELGEMSFGDVRTINIPFSKELSNDIYKIQLCLEDHCTDHNCYLQSTPTMPQSIDVISCDLSGNLVIKNMNNMAMENTTVFRVAYQQNRSTVGYFNVTLSEATGMIGTAKIVRNTSSIKESNYIADGAGFITANFHCPK